MDGGGADAAAISRPRSPNRDIQGLIGRFLQRTSSTSRTSKRYPWRSTGSAVARKELLQSERDECQSETAAAPIPVVAAAHRQSRSTAPDAGDITQPQPQQIRERPTADDMPSATPQPQLQKKTSFRDRLKAWQKPPQPLQIVTEESRPHFAYEPKHAAADFSRMVVSPLSPTRQRLPLPTQPLPEDNTPVAPRSSQRRSRNHDEDRKPRQNEQQTRRHSKSEANRHSYPLRADLFQASNAAAHIPVSSQPVAWGLGAPSVTRSEEQQPALPSQPLSDYELFIARAEAEDRERREQVLRSISQRSAAYPANRVRPDPHRQFAAVVRGSSSAERSDRSQQRTSGRYVFGGSSAGPQQQQQQQQPPPREHKPSPRKGHSHARQSSWTPSYATDGSAAAENVLERKKSPPHAQAQPRRLPALPVVASQPIVYGIDEKFDSAGQYQAQQRTLRRQASLSQRLVEYIRPKAAARPVVTLVE